ncbi:hypothetical protein Salat_0863100 [Sesamum alatum]|uniref:Uncharacterized protein n=1 Tax=Sesamum alatum TaxID=300844 RepID=A0AAE1YJL3_9LAMI|nr:hypothetical protein Salat_0863100 [Sesamum alatum]
MLSKPIHLSETEESGILVRPNVYTFCYEDVILSTDGSCSKPNPLVLGIGIQLKPSERLGIERFQELSGKVKCEALVPCLLLRKALNLQALCPALMNLLSGLISTLINLAPLLQKARKQKLRKRHWMG